jgi:hypothetical protein
LVLLCGASSCLVGRSDGGVWSRIFLSRCKARLRLLGLALVRPLAWLVSRLAASNAMDRQSLKFFLLYGDQTPCMRTSWRRIHAVHLLILVPFGTLAHRSSGNLRQIQLLNRLIDAILHCFFVQIFIPLMATPSLHGLVREVLQHRLFLHLANSINFISPFSRAHLSILLYAHVAD